MDEGEICRKRLLDLSRMADRKGIPLFSDFLNLSEQNIYRQSERLFATRTESFGGVPSAERQMIAFIPDALSFEWSYPIAALKIVPDSPKFAEDIGHRDVLGAALGLGVDRSKVGDILVGDGACYMLCEEGLADFFAGELRAVRHTPVHAARCDPGEAAAAAEPQELGGIAASNRLDALIAGVYRLSRGDAADLVRREKVFVNGALAKSASAPCADGDIVSVRGRGRFRFLGACGETGKGRMKFSYLLY